MGNFELMALPYAAEALESVISRETIGFHHGKHLAAYVNNLNGLLTGSGFEEATLEEIVCKAAGGILNNAGQILNHELYFGQFAAKPAKAEPTGTLAEAIVRDFGSFEAFKDEFQKKARPFSAAVGYGCQLTRTANSSSLRSRMRLIPFRKA